VASDKSSDALPSEWSTPEPRPREPWSFRFIGRLHVTTVSKSNLKLTTADFCADAGTETNTNATEISNTADLRISSSHLIFSATDESDELAPPHARSKDRNNSV
jgi:hypothetical protein